MADIIPLKVIRTVGDTTALAEFEPGDTIPVDQGGTGATTPATALTNLGGINLSQLNAGLAGKAPLVHNHVEADITDLDKYTQAQVDALIGAIDQSVKLYTFNGVQKPGYDTGSKILSSAEQQWQFVEGSIAGTEWMDIAGSANNSNNGYTVPFDATLVGFTISVGNAGDNNTLDLRLYIDGTDSGSIQSFSNLSGNQEFYGVLDIDLAQGQKIRVQAVESGGGNVADVSVMLFSHWRGV